MKDGFDSELDPELQELERHLQAAFTGTRPRSGFEEELWARLQYRPWWRRLLTGPALWPALGGALALIVVGVVAGLLLHGTLAPSRPAAGSASLPMSTSEQAGRCPSPSPSATASDGPRPMQSSVPAHSTPAHATPTPRC